MQKCKEECDKDKLQHIQKKSAMLQSEAASSITTKQEMRLHGEFGPPGIWGWIMAPSPNVSLLKPK